MSSLEAVVRMLAAVSAVLLVWIPADPLVVLGVLALGVGVGWRHVTTKVTDSSQRTGAWAARGPLGVLGVWALIALLADIDAVT